jgi:ribosome biogenesis GTPase / thiamine phosphate phosphatase
MKGRVLKSTGSFYKVWFPDGEIVDCKTRGSLRLKDSKSTNPVAVGDWVEVEFKDGLIHSINNVYDRSNYIIRKSVNLSKRTHVLAANIDLALIMVTMSSPRTPYGFIDRMLVTAEAYDIPAILIFNKADIWTESDVLLANEMEDVYHSAGYEVFPMVATDPFRALGVLEHLREKVSVILGQSGSGKSTLINSFNPSLHLRVGDISMVHQQGKHTTTFAEMHEVVKGTFIVDTPGLREFGLTGMNKGELGHYFPEIRSRMNQCRFNNCMHMNEPGCAIEEAMESGKIAPTRYRSYLAMMDGETPTDDY